MIAAPETGLLGKAIPLFARAGRMFPLLAASGRFAGQTSVGSLADSLINAFTGPTDDTDLPSELTKASTSAAVAGGTALATGGILKTPGAAVKLFNLGKGVVTRGGSSGAQNWLSSVIMKTAAPDLVKLSDEAQSQGLPPLTLGQVGHPIVRQIAAQVGAVSDVLKNTAIGQIEQMRQRLQYIVGQNPAQGANAGALKMLIDTEKNEITALGPVMQRMGVSDVGAALKPQIQETLQNARLDIQQKMSAAAAEAGDQWIAIPTNPLKAAAADIERGVYAPGQPGEPPVKIKGVPPELKNDIDVINKIGPELGNVEVGGKSDDAFTQFMALRDGWYDMMNSSSASPAAKQAAYKLWNASQSAISQAFSDVSTSAVNRGAMTQSFQDAKAAAMEAFSNYTETRQYLGNIASSNTPGTLAATLVRPGKAPILNMLANTGGIDIVQDGYRTMLLNNQEGAAKMITDLQRSDPSVINSVIPPDEQKAWIDWSNNATLLNRTTTARLANQGRDTLENAQTIALKESSDSIKRFVDATGGYTGSYAAGLRNGIYQDVLDNIGDPRLMGAVIDKYLGRSSALTNVLNDSDVEFLTTLKKAARQVGPTEGNISSYGSLSAGSQAKVLYDVAGLVRERSKFAMTLFNVMNKEAMARVLAQPASRALIQGAIQQGPDATGILMISKAMGLVAQNDLRKASDNKYNAKPSAPLPVYNDVGTNSMPTFGDVQQQ